MPILYSSSWFVVPSLYSAWSSYLGVWLLNEMGSDLIVKLDQERMFVINYYKFIIATIGIYKKIYIYIATKGKLQQPFINCYRFIIEI